MNRSKILIAVSSPWASQKMVTPVTDLAQRLNASVLIAHVAEVKEEDEHESDARQRGEETLKVFTAGLREAGVEADGVMLFGDDVPKAILNTARARECTLIILGLTGRGVLKRLIAGDVPGNIIRQTDLPVLLVPANWNGML